MTRARNSANLASHGNLFVDIANDRTGIGSVVPGQNLHVAGTAGFHADVTLTGDLYNTTWDRSTNSLNFADSAQLKLGTGGDIKLYHSGSHSFFTNATGNFHIRTDTLKLEDQSNGHSYITAVADGAVDLYHDNLKKFETTAYGTNTTGTAVNDGLVVAGVATVTTMNVTGVLTYDDVTSVDSVGIVTARAGVHCSTDGVANGVKIGAGQDLIIQHNGTDSFIDNNTGDLYLQTTGSGDDIIIESADDFTVKTAGSERLHIDSNSRIGIGTNNPDAPLHILSDANNMLQIESTDRHSTLYLIDSIGSSFIQNDSGALRFGTGGGASAAGGEGEAVRIDSSGNLAINKTSGISAKLHIGDTSNNGALSQLIKLGNDSSGAGTGSQINMGVAHGNESTAACIGGFLDSAGGTSFIVKTAGTYANQSTVAERFRIDSSGNVGINRTNPDQRLNVSGNIELNAYDSANGSGGYYTSKGLIIGNAYDAGISGLTDDRNGIIWQERGLDLDIGTNNTLRMKITYDGTVKITKAPSGTTSGVLLINTDYTTYGHIIVRDKNQANTACFMAENENTGSDEYNRIYRSVNRNSQAWANATLCAKTHTFRISHDGSSGDKVFINANGVKSMGTVSGATCNSFRANTSMTAYGVFTARDASNNNQHNAGFQVENPSTGADTTNQFMRSVDLNSSSWANAKYSAKSHQFLTNGSASSDIKFAVESGGDISINTVGAKIYTNNSGGNLTIQGGATYPGSAIKFNGGTNGGTGVMHFYSGNAASYEERMILTAGGSLCIGGNATGNRLTVVGPSASQAGANSGTITDSLAMLYGGKRTVVNSQCTIDEPIIHIKGQITDSGANSTGTHETGRIVFSGRRATGARNEIKSFTEWNYNNQTAGGAMTFSTAPVSSNGGTDTKEVLKLQSNGDARIYNGMAILKVDNDNSNFSKSGFVLSMPTYTEYHYVWGDNGTGGSGQAAYKITLTCGSYFHSEFIYTQHQTNGGHHMHTYARGKWANNHTTHTGFMYEFSGGGSGLTHTFTVSDQNNNGTVDLKAGLTDAGASGASYRGKYGGGNENTSSGTGSATGKFVIDETRTYNTASTSTRGLIIRVYFGSFSISKSTN